MLYYLYLVSDYGQGFGSEILKGFNVFQYITFRAVAAGVTSLVLSLLFGNWVIRRLISLKLGQPIRSQGRCTACTNCMAAKPARRPWGACFCSGRC